MSRVVSVRGILQAVRSTKPFGNTIQAEQRMRVRSNLRNGSIVEGGEKGREKDSIRGGCKTQNIEKRRLECHWGVLIDQKPIMIFFFFLGGRG